MTQPPHGRITVTTEVPGYYRAVIENPPINLADPDFFSLSETAAALKDL
jgi:hypothetical protein